MPSRDKKPPDWSKKAVVARLRRSAKPGRPVAAHVFLHAEVPAAEVASVARRLVDAASGASAPVTLGVTSKLGKSFAVTADPATVERLAGMPEVKAVLPSAIEDVYPAPVKAKPAKLGGAPRRRKPPS